jgi:hypothetical protein
MLQYICSKGGLRVLGMHSTVATQHPSHLNTYVQFGNEHGRLEFRSSVHRGTNNYHASGGWQRAALHL